MGSYAFTLLVASLPEPDATALAREFALVIH
jgi:hypothetical protein